MQRRTKMTDDCAASWAIKLDAGSLSTDEEAVLSAWLAEDPLHHGALLRAQATLAYLDRGRALAVSSESAEPPAMIEGLPHPDRRRFLQFSAGAAALTAGVGSMFVLPRLRRNELRTDLGEIRRVPLADGSVAVLNTASRLAITLEPRRRTIQLEKGEAWFQVAHDKSRPFVVESGTVRVRAVGTAFAVRQHADGADVLVTEGVVETWIDGHEEARRRLAAGSRSFVDAAVIGATSPIDSKSQDVEQALAWRGGEIVVDGQTVDYAVAELNRYNRQQIVVGDPSIGRERLVGYFRTNDPMKFADAVVDMTGAHVVQRENEIFIMR
ncbi:FecR domain-containing protein [Sphingobium sp. CR2-8]|uniref:FecR family protein n=1 Tax=Sphingobium sp. CR2-8 TaxID=1306534 RepID=UPI002DBBAABF|nr:FecR domain-containing protein [Sphingobium sp. CR2-8]MEC3909547.1 FecR domain-containing protein [Sphingobium sp. CR2-8]